MHYNRDKSQNNYSVWKEPDKEKNTFCSIHIKLWKQQNNLQLQKAYEWFLGWGLTGVKVKL